MHVKLLIRGGQTRARVRLKISESLPQMMGSVHVQYRSCGRPNCRCQRGERHPAHYLFWRVDGRLRKRYIKSDDVEVIRVACERRQQRERRRREAEREARATWQDLVGYVRGAERRD
jgi:siroheme synthase (precorrin-2 oxidase/ferrochelatase)